jgi:hypothetical protein
MATHNSAAFIRNAVNGSLRTPRHAFASEERRPNCGTPQRKRVEMRPKSVTAQLEQSLRKKQIHFYGKFLPIPPRLARVSRRNHDSRKLDAFCQPIGGFRISTFGS